MEHHKISKLLKYSVASKNLTRKWNETRNPILRSDLHESSDAYIVVKVRRNCYTHC